MAAAVAITGAKNAWKQQTITGSGFTATTAFDVFITDPGGATTRYAVTSDGSGAFTVKHYPTAPGTMTVNVRPTAERTGTTTSLATASVVVGARGD